MKLDVQDSGFNDLKATLRRLGSSAEVMAVMRPAMNAVATKILKRSITLTPRDRGGLVNSAGTQITGGAKDLTVTIGYGTPYARAVHDNPRSGRTGGVSPSGARYRHWAAIGQSKYLETAMKEAEHTAWRDVSDRVEQWLRQQGR